MDVAQAASCEAMVRQTLDRFGQIDDLVDDAAIFWSVPLERGGVHDIRRGGVGTRVMAVNVKGVWLCTRAVLPAMQEQQHGSIVNISSNMAFQGSLGMIHYVTSKAAVVGQPRAGPRDGLVQHSCERVGAGADAE